MPSVLRLVLRQTAMLVLLAATGCAIAQRAQPMTTEQIKNELIRESIASYPGNCPCPYNAARNGSSCGRRSAYSRPGGYAPVCYPSDVTDQMVESYRRRNR